MPYSWLAPGHWGRGSPRIYRQNRVHVAARLVFPFPSVQNPQLRQVGGVSPHPWTSSNLENTPTLLPRDLFPWWFKILSSRQARFFITAIYIFGRLSMCAELSPLRWKFTWSCFAFFNILDGILGTASYWYWHLALLLDICPAPLWYIEPVGYLVYLHSLSIYYFHGFL